MNAQTRRSLATLLIGAAATITGLLVSTLLRQNACRDAGGTWLPGGRCEIASGVAPSAGRAYLTGAVVGLFVLLFLLRVFTYFATRNAPPKA